jgi:adenine-specific DNA-methyltransferase
MPAALAQVISDVDAPVVVVSYNDESWVSLAELMDMCSVKGHVEVIAFDSKRYVGAQIGIYNPSGFLVGEISHLCNMEYIAICGDRPMVEQLAAACKSGQPAKQTSLF